jgi:pilus assembly protein CpaD
MTRKHLGNCAAQLTAFARHGLLLTALGATLAGCETMQEEAIGSIGNDYRQRHPISIVEKNRTLKVFVGSARNGLTPDQRIEVLDYAMSWRGEGTGRFVIDQPIGARNTSAAAAALREIRSILAAAGVPARAVRVQSYQVAERNLLAVIILNYPHTAAHAGPCGKWPDDLGPSADANHFEDSKHFKNLEYYNLGCATQRNLAAMVANPADLVQPRADGPVYTMRRTMVLEKYRKGESPSTTDPNSDKSKISDIGSK